MSEEENDIKENMDSNMLSVEEKLILGGIFLLKETSTTTLL